MINIDTLKKDKDGYYIISEIGGPFNYIIKSTSNRVVVGGTRRCLPIDAEIATGVAVSGSQDVYFWQTIPSSTPAQDYNGSITITASQT